MSCRWKASSFKNSEHYPEKCCKNFLTVQDIEAIAFISPLVIMAKIFFATLLFLALMEVSKMRVSLIVLWVLVGWCGSEPRLWLLLRRWWPTPPIPPPGPDPWPILFLTRIIGIVGGIGGGWAYTQVLGPQTEPWTSAVPAAATALGAFLGARLLVDIYGLLTGSRNG